MSLHVDRPSRGFVRPAPPPRPRVANGLPKGLPHYEFLRHLDSDQQFAALWNFGVVHDPTTHLPIVSPSDPPPFEPLDLRAWLNNPPDGVELEIGCGKGRFLIDYAELHPARGLIAIEWNRVIACHVADRLNRRPHLSHVRVVCGDALPFVRDRLPSSSLDAVHLYFPDPWPKERARKRRSMGPFLLAQIRRIAKPGCRFFWGTDFAEYNDATTALLEATDGFVCLNPSADRTDGISTGFETKYVREGRPIYRSVWGVIPTT